MYLFGLQMCSLLIKIMSICVDVCGDVSSRSSAAVERS